MLDLGFWEAAPWMRVAAALGSLIMKLFMLLLLMILVIVWPFWFRF